jgi:hypothetical protein
MSEEKRDLWRENLDAFSRAKPEPSLATMAQVERLLAIEELRQVALKYARCQSQKDIETFRDLFAPDYAFSHPRFRGGETQYGGEGMVALLKEWGPFNDRVTTIMHCHGSEVELLAPTKARAQWAADAYIYHRPDTLDGVTGRTDFIEHTGATGKEVVQPGVQVHFCYIMYQTYGKLEGKWKIKSNTHLDMRYDHEMRVITLPSSPPPWPH